MHLSRKLGIAAVIARTLLACAPMGLTAPAGIRYVEPVISGSSGIILHPNLAGESADSVDVLSAMKAAGIH
jgi:hypothetical protein